MQRAKGRGRRAPTWLAESAATAEPNNTALAAMVEQARAGSGLAFESLAGMVGPRLYRLLVVRLGDQAEARDAMQETLLAAWQGLPRLRDPAKFWPWLAAIAVRKAADARHDRAVVAERGAEPCASPDVAPLVELRVAIDELPSDLRDTLLLRYLLGLSEQETAQALGIRVGTVKSRTARARRRTQVAISDSEVPDGP